MKITNLSTQQNDPNRVNIFVDGNYRFSLDISQVVTLGVKIGREYSEHELKGLEEESQFGKLYMKALEYCLMRPHSAKEVKDYLGRKIYPTRYRSRKTGEIKERQGVSRELVDRVFDRLVERSYVDDESFTKYWLENRSLSRGVSQRRLRAELRTKGIDERLIDDCLQSSGRLDTDEIQKIVDKKRRKYPDDKKLAQYLVRQGFNYHDVLNVLGRKE